jgi:hypothetical protein
VQGVIDSQKLILLSKLTVSGQHIKEKKSSLSILFVLAVDYILHRKNMLEKEHLK